MISLVQLCNPAVTALSFTVTALEVLFCLLKLLERICSVGNNHVESHMTALCYVHGVKGKVQKDTYLPKNEDLYQLISV